MKKSTTSLKAKAPAVVEWDLRLYVAGMTLKSSIAIRNLERLCEEHLADNYRIEIVDLAKNPQLGQARPDSSLASASAKTAFSDPQNDRQSVRYAASSREPRAGKKQLVTGSPVHCASNPGAIGSS